MIAKSKSFCPGVNETGLLKIIKDNRGNGYIKKGTFSTEIIWNKKSFVFHTGKKEQTENFKKGLYLFKRVREEANLYLKKKKNIKLPKQERSILYNHDGVIDSDKKVCGTDLNHAYWRIALNLGVISEETYKMALPKCFKSTRLAALSTLGAGRTFNIIVNGKVSKDIAKFGERPELKKVYTLIRYTCFKHMKKLADMLGDDFLAYKTDCIYYYDTPNNRAVVTQYLEAKGFTFKHLS